MVMTNPVGRPKGQESILWYTKRCASCGDTFKSSRHDAVTCSPTCRKRLWRERQTAKRQQKT